MITILFALYFSLNLFYLQRMEVPGICIYA